MSSTATRKPPTAYFWASLHVGDSHFVLGAKIERVREAWLAYKRRNHVCREWVIDIFESGSGVTYRRLR